MANSNSQEQKDSLLPPPEILVKYQELGINEDLINLVKIEQEHRHKLQNGYQLSYRIGQLFGFIIALFFLHGIFKMANNGKILQTYIIFGLFALLITILTIISKSGRKQTIKKTINVRNTRIQNQRRNSRNYSR